MDPCPFYKIEPCSWHHGLEILVARRNSLCPRSKCRDNLKSGKSILKKDLKLIFRAKKRESSVMEFCSLCSPKHGMRKKPTRLSHSSIPRKKEGNRPQPTRQVRIQWRTKVKTLPECRNNSSWRNVRDDHHRLMSI